MWRYYVRRQYSSCGLGLGTTGSLVVRAASGAACGSHDISGNGNATVLGGGILRDIPV